jgi:putative DNA primase/helicase
MKQMIDLVEEKKKREEKKRKIYDCPYLDKHMTSTGVPRCTIENIAAILIGRNLELFWDELKNERVIRIMNKKEQPSKDMLEAMLKSFANQDGMATGNDWNDFLDALAKNTPYNPVRGWIESKPWDGKKRLEDFFDSVKVKSNTYYRNAIIKRWMIAAIAALFLEEGIAASGVLVFQGAQHRGKTKWFKSLIADHLKEYIKDGMHINPHKRDSVMACLRHWLVELGELDSTLLRHDFRALKAFVTSDADVWRLSYAKRERRFVRRTLFYGSVNEEYFLQDKTGNRRWWTVEIESCNENHGFDMQQVWAEVYDLFKNGETYNLTEEERQEVERVNLLHTFSDPIEEMIICTYDWDKVQMTNSWRWLTAAQILEEIGWRKPTTGECSKVAGFIGELNKGFRKKLHGATLHAIPHRRNNDLGT